MRSVIFLVLIFCCFEVSAADKAFVDVAVARLELMGQELRKESDALRAQQDALYAVALKHYNDAQYKDAVLLIKKAYTLSSTHAEVNKMRMFLRALTGDESLGMHELIIDCYAKDVFRESK